MESLFRIKPTVRFLASRPMEADTPFCTHLRREKKAPPDTLQESVTRRQVSSRAPTECYTARLLKEAQIITELTSSSAQMEPATPSSIILIPMTAAPPI